MTRSRAKKESAYTSCHGDINYIPIIPANLHVIIVDLRVRVCVRLSNESRRFSHFLNHSQSFRSLSLQSITVGHQPAQIQIKPRVRSVSFKFIHSKQLHDTDHKHTSPLTPSPLRNSSPHRRCQLSSLLAAYNVPATLGARARAHLSSSSDRGEQTHARKRNTH